MTKSDTRNVKQSYKKKVLYIFFKNSIFIYLALVLAMVGLFSFVYFSHNRLVDHYEHSKTSHQLSVLALLLSEENYHTQLEIYEVFSMPDQKRIDDFYLHEKLFQEKLDATYRAFSTDKENVSAEVISKLDALKSSIPRIQNKWKNFLSSVKNKHSQTVQAGRLVEAEEAFDDENFNKKIQEIVQLQLAEVEKADDIVKERSKQNHIAAMLGIFIAFLLTILVTVLSRTALKSKVNELQLVQAGKMASLGQLSAGMAHEINSPLMFIKGFNSRIKSALKSEALDEKHEVWDYINEVDEGVERINKIVKNFRDFTRLSKNEMSPVSINQIIQKSFILFEEQLRLREIFVELNLSNLNPIINADPNRIEQVMLNLISNSRDAIAETGPGKNRISVSTQYKSGHVIIKFSDTGCGIAEKNRSRIFEPFFTTKPSGIGTGLGLSISAGIIRDHMGMIDVESEVGRGTRISITLPAYKALEKPA